MLTTRRQHAIGVLVLSAFATLAVRAAGQQPERNGKDTAPVGSPTSTAPVGSARRFDSIGEDDRERARQVALARQGLSPFQPSGVWVPPFYLANAEHSIEWIALLYIQTTDFEESRRTR